MGGRAYHDRGHSAYEIRIDNIGKNPLDRQLGRQVGGRLVHSDYIKRKVIAQIQFLLTA